MLNFSATDALWQMAEIDPSHAAELVAAVEGLPQALANILAGRGIGAEEIPLWLDPKIRHLMPDPSCLADMDRTADRLTQAVIKGAKIGIFSDYDVDGACSAAVLYGVLTGLGAEVEIYIPDRFTEGYGPNLPALMQLKNDGCGLIICADCGTTAHAPIEAMAAAGAEIIVIDHHIPDGALPPAIAVVNPNRLDDESGQGVLCAAGVAFLVMVALVRQLRGEGVFSEERPEPDLMAELDLVALATVADVVPLTGLNRAFIRTGLAVMARRDRIGLALLADIAALKSAPDVHALGFVLGPRINAGGRMGNARLGAQLLIAQDRMAAEPPAIELDELNKARREEQEKVIDEAIDMVESQLAEGEAPPPFIMAMGDWHEGVIGIAASRLKEHFHRPAAVVSLAPDGGTSGTIMGKASARSIAPFKLGEAILEAKKRGLVPSGGGHNMAAGFALNPAQKGDFLAFMVAAAEQAFGDTMPIREHKIDTKIAAGHCTPQLLDWLDRAGPWGTGFPEPVFMLEGVSLSGVAMMGGDGTHRRFGITDATGSVAGVAFGWTGLAGALDSIGDGEPCTIIGRLNRNNYGGRMRVQFIALDLRSG